MNEKVYQLVPCANGYLVILPYKQYNQFEGLGKVLDEAKARDAGMPLPASDESETNSRSFVFTSLNEAMSFLKLKLEGEL